MTFNLQRGLRLLPATALLVLAAAALPLRAGDDAGPARAFMAAMQAAAEEEAYAMGVEAYLYGYPRVELARRIHNETRRVSPRQAIFAPPNRFFYFDRRARPGDGLVLKTPNNDTLYASAYLDLSAGPVLLHVPPVGSRYYVALVVDAAGNVDTRIGRKVTGPGGVDLAFVGPGFRGRNAPVEAQALEAPLAPLDSFEFFAQLHRMLARNPVPPQDRGLLARWERIGLGAGAFDADRLSPAVRRGLERAIASGARIVAAAQFSIANTLNGWKYADKIGRLRNDWALNAAIARGGYGNLPEDAVYRQRNLDARGEQLSGARRYTLTFAPGELPPVGAFWSITAYDQSRFDLLENPIRRYSVGDRTSGLRHAPDGSLTLALQADEPAAPVLRANWLPVGAGAFFLVMRCYDPAPAIAQGRWAPPEVMAGP